MLRYSVLKKSRRDFLSLTGQSVKEFERLLPAFKQADQELHPDSQTLQGTRRQRQAGGGRRGVLDDVEQRLLFILVYHKTYPTQTMMGKMFDISQSQANYWIHRLTPVLKRGLEIKDKQVMHYSGKQKTHPDKNIAIVDRQTNRLPQTALEVVRRYSR
ncbi:MAG: transposase family protein [Anaerolineae bacterium]|nr:transposase family protein [Anaerolineae bacterium]